MAKRKKTNINPKGGKLPRKGSKSSLPVWLVNIQRNSWLIFAVCCFLYANTLTHDYAQDDAIVITDNMFTQQGIAGIPGILQYDTFYGFFKEEGKAQLVAGGRYRPLSLLMFAVEVQLFGQQPFVGHLVNILLYGFIAVLLYWLLLKLLLPTKSEAFGYFVALVTALLFAVHPIHTEVVANIKGRDEILALLGGLSALYFALKAFETRTNLPLILAAVFFFLGLMAKENAITFLAIVPLSFYFFTKAKAGEIALYTAPLVVATIVFLAIRFSILGSGLGEPSMELMNNPFLKLEGGRYVALGFGEKMATVLFTLGKYIQLLIFPHPLSHDYYPRQIALMAWSDWQVLLSFALYLGMVIVAIRGLAKKDPISFGILFYLATLSIVSNILFAVGTTMSERFMFMPSIGFALVVGVLLFRYLYNGKKNLMPLYALLAVVLLLFSIKTITRNPVWKDNYALFLSDVENAPNSAKLRNAAGGELITQSQKLGANQERQKNEMLTEAAGHLQEAIRIHPTFKNAHLLLGNCYNYLKQYENAVTYYQNALELDPGYEEAINNLGITYRDAGRYFGEEKGDLAKALSYLEKAYSMRPDEYETLRLLGVAYGIKGDAQKAIFYFNEALKQNPDDANALFNLGTAYLNAGKVEEGNQYHQRARTIDPNVGARE